MKLTTDYVWEKLFAGVVSIAEVDLGIKQRLANAYVSQIIRLHETGDMTLEIPDTEADRLREILVRLRESYRSDIGQPYGDFNFDEEEAANIIRDLVEIYDVVCRLMPQWEG